MDREEFTRRLYEALGPRYLDKHPFMALLYKGKLTKKQLQAWIINRFYLQNNIISKDAAILTNCPVPQVRRIWMSRTIRREGLERPPGDIEGWLVFAEAAGLKREAVLSARCLPGVRFAVDELVAYALKVPWLDGVALSLYELLAKDELAKRLDALKRHYAWIDESGLRFFLARLAHIRADSEIVLELVLKYCETRESQESALGAALFMADVMQSLHDSIYMGYVVGDLPLSASLQ